MGQLSAKLRGAADGYTLFFCPGCEDAHAIRVGTGPGPRWAWNGNADAPTFTPSILVTATVPPPREPDDPPDRVCHSFITDGRIRFLGDCRVSGFECVSGGPWKSNRWRSSKEVFPRLR